MMRSGLTFAIVVVMVVVLLAATGIYIRAFAQRPLYVYDNDDDDSNDINNFTSNSRTWCAGRTCDSYRVRCISSVLTGFETFGVGHLLYKTYA